MGDWLREYSAALEERLGPPEPGAYLPIDLKNPLLDLARIVAHGTERKNAPLATYIAGRYVSIRSSQGIDDARAVSEAIEIARAITPAEK